MIGSALFSLLLQPFGVWNISASSGTSPYSNAAHAHPESTPPAPKAHLDVEVDVDLDLDVDLRVSRGAAVPIWRRADMRDQDDSAARSLRTCHAVENEP